MITAFQSDKIKILSFIATILVLYMHSSFHSFEIDGMKINNDIQYIISGIIGRCAVPYFYIISGYLFFQKTLSLSSIYDKIRKRIRTLLVPYLIGCIFMAVFTTLVCIIPMVKPYLNNSDLSLYNNSLLHIINSIFWDSGTGSPFAFHLWYIKDLLIIVLFSPLLYFAFLQVKHYLLLALWIAVFLFPDYRIITSTLWFCIGSYFALYPSSIKWLHKKTNNYWCYTDIHYYFDY